MQVKNLTFAFYILRLGITVRFVPVISVG